MSFPPMDVRCEKCQTEYELDESRLKPGGVTVKCTNCGHMFKIRKRTPTNVGGPAVGTAPGLGVKAGQPDQPRADSIFEPQEGPTTVERQWVIRLESGEQKTCRELATLQQWIVGNVVTRESLISRTGKTWKRLGDIPELAQYFDIADEARRTRGDKETKPTGKTPVKGAAGTMLGMGSAPTAAGGTILPDDEEEGRSTGNYRSAQGKRPTTQPPPVPGSRTPPMGSNVTTPASTSGGVKRPLTAPPGPPPQTTKPKTPTGPVPQVNEPRPAQATPAPPKTTPAPPIGPDARSTAAWATDPIKATGIAPSGPYHGKLAAIPDEPAFTGPGGPGGRVRMAPSEESSFETGKVGLVDDDDLMPPRRGSKAGLIVLLMMLLVGAGAAAVVYVFVIKKDTSAKNDTVVVADAGVSVVDAASLVVTPMIDAAPEPPPLSPIEVAAGELAGDNETRLRASLDTLPKDAPETQAARANIGAAIAQALIDRAGLVADKSEAVKLRKESKTIVLEAATAAQRAMRATPEDAAANVSMAHVLRLQGKSAKDMRRYIDTAKSKADKTWARDVELAEALVLARDGKLDDAKKLFETIDSGDNKLETSNDVRARFHRALIALAQNKAADAKPLVDQVLAAQPEHLGAKALAAKLETKVSSTDPLPPEDPGKGSSRPPDVSTGGSYDQLLARANKLAESNCSKAMELYAKALEQKPNGVEALSGQGYCHIDAKQFASAHSKFRSALAISSRFEPALWGIAEAYQQQGRREQAVEAYKAYLEIYPNTAKALKQIERLSPAPGGGSGSATPTPTPPPGDGSAQPQKPDAPRPNDPTPTPTPEGGGSGAQ